MGEEWGKQGIKMISRKYTLRGTFFGTKYVNLYKNDSTF